MMFLTVKLCRWCDNRLFQYHVTLCNHVRCRSLVIIDTSAFRNIQFSVTVISSLESFVVEED